ncbi:MAG: hypothetical protein IPM68_09935 [Flavobacteriales bacterium]|nr:hypothetical protein [Flavobacteriales bacterium]
MAARPRGAAQRYGAGEQPACLVLRHRNGPGIYFWCGSDQLLTHGTHASCSADAVCAKVFRYLRDAFHCRYVFSTGE